MPTLVSIIIPTLNERESLPTLFDEFMHPAAELTGKDVSLELIIVDDGSTDGTADYAKSEDANRPFTIRVISRSERGLATAVIRGFAEATGEYLIAMDADGSHPATLIPEVVHALTSGADLVLPSRYMPGGGSEDWTYIRKFISRTATLMARVVGIRASDPMSGFFGLKRSVIDGVTLSPIGYKILLEVLVKGTYRSSQEIAYIFRNRVRGESKMTSKVVLEYLKHLGKLWLWKRTH